MTLEMINNKRKRLIYRSWHRGTKEMDKIMGSFSNKYVPDFSENELDLYAEVLEYSDLDMYDWICGRAEVPEDKKSKILDLLLEHDYAKDRSSGSDEAQLG